MVSFGSRTLSAFVPFHVDKVLLLVPPLISAAIFSTAIFAFLFGLNPYEHSWKSASNIGSTISFTAACTTLSLMVGMPIGRSLPFAFSM